MYIANDTKVFADGKFERAAWEGANMLWFHDTFKGVPDGHAEGTSQKCENLQSILLRLRSLVWKDCMGNDHLEAFSAEALCREFRKCMRILMTFLGEIHHNSHKKS